MINQEPKAWLHRNAFNFVNRSWQVSKIEPTNSFDIVKPLFDIGKVFMTDDEYNETVALLDRSGDRGFGRLYEVLGAIKEGVHDARYMFLRKRLFENDDDKLDSEKQFEFALLFMWNDPKKLIEVVEVRHWYVKYKEGKNNTEYNYLALHSYSDSNEKNAFSMDNRKQDATYFESKEEAEEWTTPYTEASFEEED